MLEINCFIVTLSLWLEGMKNNSAGNDVPTENEPKIDTGKKVTRDELHKELWRAPISKLAVAWSVPIASIVKAAEKMNVPRPASGHWQLVRLGRGAGPEPLPAADASTILSTTLVAGRRKPKPKPAEGPAPAAPELTVSGDVREMHKLVHATYVTMKNAPLIEGGPIKIEDEGTFDVWVSRPQLRRALLILDAIVRGVEERGGSFVKGLGLTNHLVAEFPEGEMAFKIAEQMEHNWTPTKREYHPSGGYYQHHEWRYVPKGPLAFYILEYRPTGARKAWRDGKRQRVEDCVPAIVECLQEYPKLARQEREQQAWENAESQRRWHEEYLRRSAPERLEKMMGDLKKHIQRQSRLWERAKNLRNYLAAWEATVLGSGKAAAADGWEQRWLTWGREWVNSFDPLTPEAIQNLKSKFIELEELEAFVAQLKNEGAFNESDPE
jgi:hypothetical protein